MPPGLTVTVPLMVPEPASVPPFATVTALPAANESTCSHNATQLGKLAGSSAKATNQRLALMGFQFRNERDEWELTDAGKAWAEAMPFSRNGHSGYQILWNPAVVDQLKEVA